MKNTFSTLSHLLLFIVLLNSSCAPYIPITNNSDEFSGKKILKMDNCELEPNYPSKIEGLIFDRGYEKVELNLEYIYDNKETAELSVIAKITSKNEAFTIDSGNSLILLIDDEIIKLPTSGGYNSDVDVDSKNFSITTIFSSNAKYPITKEIINKIANATVAKARILAFDQHADEMDKPSIEGLFLEGQKNAYSNFLKSMNEI